MKGRLQIAFAVVATLVVALLLVGGFLVRNSRAAWLSESAKREEAKLRVQSLYKARPFPNEANVAIEAENLRRLREEAAARLVARFARDPVEAQPLSPGRFVNLLDEQRRELIDAAAQRGVAVPDRFAFGFDTYVGRDIPKQEDVGRLTQQLFLIDMLVREALEAGVADLLAVQRETFERTDDAPAVESSQPGGRARTRPAVAAVGAWVNPQAGVIPPQGLFGRFRFELQCRAREKALFDLLDRLARLPQFVVVRSVTFDTPGTGVLPPVAPRVEATAAAGERRMRTRDERVVSGEVKEQPVLVTLQIDVYLFPPSETPVEVNPA